MSEPLFKKRMVISYNEAIATANFSNVILRNYSVFRKTILPLVELPDALRLIDLIPMKKRQDLLRRFRNDNELWKNWAKRDFPLLLHKMEDTLPGWIYEGDGEVAGNGCPWMRFYTITRIAYRTFIFSIIAYTRKKSIDVLPMVVTGTLRGNDTIDVVLSPKKEYKSLFKAIWMKEYTGTMTFDEFLSNYFAFGIYKLQAGFSGIKVTSPVDAFDIFYTIVIDEVKSANDNAYGERNWDATTVNDLAEQILLEFSTQIENSARGRGIKSQIVADWLVWYSTTGYHESVFQINDGDVREVNFYDITPGYEERLEGYGKYGVFNEDGVWLIGGNCSVCEEPFPAHKCIDCDQLFCSEECSSDIKLHCCDK